MCLAMKHAELTDGVGQSILCGLLTGNHENTVLARARAPQQHHPNSVDAGGAGKAAGQREKPGAETQPSSDASRAH